MNYKLIISERAELHIDNILEYMAETFGYCNDIFLADHGYRKIALSGHDYLILYRVKGTEVHISGVFHMRENYAQKL